MSLTLCAYLKEGRIRWPKRMSCQRMVFPAMPLLAELGVLMPDMELRVVLPPGVDGTVVLPQSLGGIADPV
jgi:hypothetical protein